MTDQLLESKKPPELDPQDELWEAVRTCVKALEPLSERARKRVLAFVKDKLDEEAGR